jgi:hypothetical protein
MEVIVSCVPHFLNNLPVFMKFGTYVIPLEAIRTGAFLFFEKKRTSIARRQALNVTNGY